ncbi:MAG TPA: AAA family ATPase [Burkholderiales bacterium]|nr:AAA family ATPase [Burkholderiales bacterium]
MNDQRDLTLILKSRFPLVVIKTHEEQRVFGLLERIANLESWALFGWSVVEGLRRVGIGQRMVQTNELRECLKHIEATPQNGIYVLFDAHKYLEDPINVRLIKEVALNYAKTSRTLVFVSHELRLPEEVGRFAAHFELSVPDMNGLRTLMKEEAQLWQKQQGEPARGQQETLDALLRCLVGLPLEDARRLIRQALHDDGVISASDVTRIGRQKLEMLGEDGVLTLEPDSARLHDVAGLGRLKRWLELRRQPFLDLDNTTGLDVPKGVLMLGVQGSGKSLAAKATAGAWGVPLLRLDFAALYNKYHGETERNLRQSLKTAEAMAPCVLWIDELEKGLAADSGDDGLSKRVLGALLTWMSERESRVFLAATANDVSALPPELLRKGRFDEIFFVDLPDAETRKEVFLIHLRRRKLDPQGFDLDACVSASEGFAGAEIEQAIVAAKYESHASQKPLDTQMLVDELKRTKPLSVVMAERVTALREWAKDRTVPAC